MDNDDGDGGDGRWPRRKMVGFLHDVATIYLNRRAMNGKWQPEAAIGRTRRPSSSDGRLRWLSCCWLAAFRASPF